jgi:hypothetical protein
MTDTPPLAERLERNRAAIDSARAALQAARTESAELQAERRSEERFGRGGRGDAMAGIDARIRELAGEEVAAQDEHAAQTAVRDTLLAMMAEQWDPTVHADRLSDAYPILMFPLRVETRFMEVDAGPQLWVRVFPDECLIDGFEPGLTAAELASAKQFWTAFRAAGSNDMAERSAWRDLVAGHGAGRASWIVSQYRPSPGVAPPVKAADDDVILVVATQAPPSPAVVQALSAYWIAVWAARGDPSALAAAAAALDAAVGAQQAAGLRADYLPAGFEPLRGGADSPAGAAVQIDWLILPPDPATRAGAWTEPSTVRLLPERLAVIGYTGTAKAFERVGAPIPWPLQAGPDPAMPPAGQAQGWDVDGGLGLAWLFDFEQAIASGLGFRIDLTRAQFEAGFDRLLVAGIRMDGTTDSNRALIEEWIAHQYHSRRGFAFLPQGTATNNTEGAASGHGRGDDPDASFELMFRGQSAFAPSGDAHVRPDGQWFADLVGVDPAVLQSVAGAAGAEAAEARAMNEALWPATLGYMLETMMNPLFGEEEVDGVRRFFTDFVLGRGFLPAIRVGRQPYGILPTTAFSRIKWLDVPNRVGVASDAEALAFNRILRGVYGALQGTADDWRDLAATVSRGGGGGAPHKLLLDIIGLHPASVHYSERLAIGAQQVFGAFGLWGGQDLTALVTAMAQQAAMATLADAGYAGADTPDLLTKFFQGTATPFPGPPIDDRPLSEVDPIRPYTGDGRNYLTWLRDAASASFDSLRDETGFAAGPPKALLYVLLRHALQLGYWDAGVRLHETAKLLGTKTPVEIRREQSFVGFSADGESGSRYDLLYATEPAITGAANMPVVDFIGAQLATGRNHPAYRLLYAQLAALATLEGLPTARLERLMVESLDCCSYRRDAWRQGLVQHRLTALRHPTGESEAEVRRGLHLGAYSWLEDVRRKPRDRVEVRLDGDLALTFGARSRPRPGPGSPTEAWPRDESMRLGPSAPLMSDSRNAGYIHAPSLNHAVTAAILRNGHLANAVPAQPGLLSVNLSSERVRQAVALLEGLREGQSLSALLGYRLERALHDRHGALHDLHELIYILREAFPLAANQMADTQAPPGTPIEAIGANNVLDGRALIDRIRTSGVKAYPFGLALTPIAADQSAALDAEVDSLLDLYDALADIAVAEGVHQVAGGNFARAGATLDTFARAGFPIEPEVLQTPRSGINLEHRVALHLETAFDPAVSPVAGIRLTPRAIAQPALNRWLARVLPPPARVACKVRYLEPGATAPTELVVTQSQLKLQPIDMLYAAVVGGGQAMTELDDRIAGFVLSQRPALPDVGVEILYSEAIPAHESMFEVSALLRELRALLLRSRALAPGDMLLPAEAEKASGATTYTDSAALASIASGLGPLAASLDAFAASLELQLADTATHGAALLSQVDRHLGDLSRLMARAGLHAVPGASWGGLLQDKGRLFGALRQRVAERVADWSGRHAEFLARIADHALPAGIAEDEKIARLKRAERLISTSLTGHPATSAAFLAALQAKQSAFEAKLVSLKLLEDTNRTALGDFLGDVQTATNSIGPFDPKPFDTADLEARILALEGELASRARTLAAAVLATRARAQQALAAHLPGAAAADRVEALEGAAKALFGDDFRFLPQFDLPAAAAAEIAGAIGAGATGGLLDHLETTLGLVDPVDHWLCGVARVREKVARWEGVTLFSEAFGAPALALTPIQLPYAPGASWLALEYPDSQKLEEGYLLYTAHFAAPFQAGGRHCGLLLDEWSEVVPAPEVVTGLAFHCDRPNGEAPQALLLVTPPDIRGHWLWEDVVDSLGETLDLARERAVEPDQLDAMRLGRFLPAVILATSVSHMTISTRLAGLAPDEGG